MHEETVYDALTAAHGDDARWAFGAGFDDPLAGVDTTVPDGVDPADAGHYCLMLGDDALVLSQRLTEWVTRAPELEEEVAFANVALDLLGQARLLLARAGSVGVLGRSRERATASIPDEDALAFFRDADEFRCCALVAAPGGDFARTLVRLLVASAWRLALFARLATPATRCWPRSPQGRRRAGLPPRPRGPLGAAPRRRDGGVAPARPGRRWTPSGR